MNKHIAFIGLVIGLALFTGCTTTDSTTGEKVYDPVKTDLLVNFIEDGLSEVVYWTARADENTASAYRIASTVIDAMITDGVTADRTEIQNRLLTIKVDGLAEADSRALIIRVSDMIMGKWDIIVDNYVRVGVTSNQASLIGLTTAKKAIDRGLNMLAQ